MYFCYGWVFWMYLQWLPTYLSEVRHFAQIKMGLAASVPLIAATIDEHDGRLALRQAGADVGRSAPRQGGGGGGRASRSPAWRSCPACWRTTRSTGLACLTIAMAGLELTVPVAWALCLDIAGDFSGSVTGVMNTLGQPGRRDFRGDDRLSGDDFRMDRAISGVQRAVRRGGAAGHANRPEPLGCGRIPN